MHTFAIVTGLILVGSGLAGPLATARRAARAGKAVTVRTWVGTALVAAISLGGGAGMVARSLGELGLIAYDPAVELAGLVGLIVCGLIGVPFWALDLRDQWREANRPPTRSDGGGTADTD
jgi:hypothetical protein